MPRACPGAPACSGVAVQLASRSRASAERLPGAALKPASSRPLSAVSCMVGELSTRSDEFRRRWGAHNVRTHGTGVSLRTAGALELGFGVIRRAYEYAAA